MQRLLVIDDEPSICFAIGEYFSLMCHEVDTARDVESARRMIAGVKYDAAVVDLCLLGSGDRSGLGLIRDARAAGLAGPIVLLTAFGDRSLPMEGRLHGADLTMIKPVSMPHLAAAMARVAAARAAAARLHVQ